MTAEDNKVKSMIFLIMIVVVTLPVIMIMFMIIEENFYNYIAVKIIKFV